MCTAANCGYGGCGIDAVVEIPGEDIDEKPRTCAKCGSGDATETKGRNAYCETCLLNITSHKFRATLGKSKIIRKGDAVLVAYSGKPNATMLAHLIKAGNEQSVHKRLIFETKLIYVDDGVVRGSTVDQRTAILREIETQTSSVGMATYAVSLNRCSTEETPILKMKEYHPDAVVDQSLQQLFDRLRDDTGRDDLLRRLRRKVLISTARELGCGKVFFADTSTDLAVKVLGDAAVGRGSHLSADAAFCDTRCQDVMFLRPMREFTRNDVEFYTRHHGLKPLTNSEGSRSSFPLSVRNLASDFIRGLSSEFSGTVSAVYRTSEKLGERSVDADEEPGRKCGLCDSVILEDDSSSLSAVQATAFSKLVSSHGTAARFLVDAFTRNEGLHEQNGLRHPVQSDSAARSLCYGCRAIFSTSGKESTVDLAPSFLRDAIREEARLEEMRERIVDFLL